MGRARLPRADRPGRGPLPRRAPPALLHRPTDLLDLHPAWAGAHPGATTIALQGLSADQTDSAHRPVAADAPLPAALRRGSARQPRATRSSSRNYRPSAGSAGARCLGAPDDPGSADRRGSTSSTRPSAQCSSAVRSRAASSTAARCRRLPLTSHAGAAWPRSCARPSPSRPPAPRRRGRVSLPAPADPRRCVRRPAQRGSG